MLISLPIGVRSLIELHPLKCSSFIFLSFFSGPKSAKDLQFLKSKTHIFSKYFKPLMSDNISQSDRLILNISFNPLKKSKLTKECKPLKLKKERFTNEHKTCIFLIISQPVKFRIDKFFKKFNPDKSDKALHSLRFNVISLDNPLK